jgi:DNA-binding response OmpR family regulator
LIHVNLDLQCQITNACLPQPLICFLKGLFESLQSKKNPNIKCLNPSSNRASAWLSLILQSFRRLYLMKLNTSTARLLLIDDSMADLRVLTEITTRHGWNISVAFNGQDGYHKALMSPFDLILLDRNMPVLDGFATCRMLKANAQTRNIPVVFLSAAGDQESRLTGLLLGAVDYIVKSYANEAEIAARIAICLQKSNYTQSPEAEDVSLNERLPGATLVKAAKKILLESIAQTFVADQLAAKLGCTEKRLNEAFRAQYALTAIGWLRMERLRIGRQMLASTDASINDIAINLGFSSGQNFATAFREHFDGTPSEYRLGLRQQRQSKDQ